MEIKKMSCRVYAPITHHIPCKREKGLSLLLQYNEQPNEEAVSKSTIISKVTLIDILLEECK